MHSSNLSMWVFPQAFKGVVTVVVTAGSVISSLLLIWTRLVDSQLNSFLQQRVLIDKETFFSRFVHLRMTMKKTTILLLLLVCYSVKWRHPQFWKLITRELSSKQETPTWESPSQHLNFMPPYTQPGKMQNVFCSFQLTLWRPWV